jgi:predicted Zn-dependent protease
MVLEIQEPGIDPQAAAERYMKQESARFSTAAPLRIGDLDAFRARGSINTIAGPADAEVTWIAHNGNIFRLTAGALSRGFRRYAGIFRSFPRSFRPLRADELEQMSDLRLQIARAEEGETLAQLSERVGNEWGLNRLGVVNRLSIDQTLPEGHLVKVAIRTPYRPEEAEATQPEPENAEDPVFGPAEYE